MSLHPPELEEYMKLDETGTGLIWTKMTSTRNPVGKKVGNINGYFKLHNVKYRVPEVINGPVPEVEPTQSTDVAIHPNQDDPNMYFVPGTKEYKYLDKTIHKALLKYKKILYQNDEYEDFYQEGMIGALRAKRNYVPNGKTKFSTFMYHYVNGYILNHVRGQAENRLNGEIVGLKDYEYLASNLIAIEEEDSDTNIDISDINIGVLTKPEREWLTGIADGTIKIRKNCQQDRTKINKIKNKLRVGNK